MTKNELENIYLNWMAQLVLKEPYCGGKSYTKLVTYLYNIEFTYSIGLDGNRAEDGMNLRYRFGYEQGYPNMVISNYLDYRFCSVLEMMVALCVRCEEHIMADPDIGDRTSKWFWTMIESLGLCAMSDYNFDENYVGYVIYKFLNRKYKPNGEGGLFTNYNRSEDMRKVEIWYQACWYLNRFL